MDMTTIAYLIFWLIVMLSVARIMGAFFSQRRTSLSVQALIYAAYYLSGAMLFLFVRLPILSMILGLTAVFAITLTFESTMKKRLLVTTVTFAIFNAVELFYTIFFALDMDSFLDRNYIPEQATAANFITVGVTTYLVAMLVSRFKGIKKNAVIKLPMFWVTSMAVPVLSFLIMMWAVFYFPFIYGISSAIVILLINIFIFYFHDLMSSAYEMRLEAARHISERMQAMLDSSPLACVTIYEDSNITEVNQKLLDLLEISSPEVYMEDRLVFSPEFQPDGQASRKKSKEFIDRAFSEGRANYEWMMHTHSKELIPCEITLVRVSVSGDMMLICYIKDLREIKTLVEMKENLENLAFTDSLTGMHNRRYFEEAAERILLESSTNNQPLSVLMMDIDHFKRVNDIYGHVIGDEVLQIFAKRIKHVLRHDALAARYGGEEFVVMLPDTADDNAMTTARRIHENINKLPFVINELIIPITTSIGVSTYSGGNTTLTQIIDMADSALYHVKKTGRNSVCSYFEGGNPPPQV